MPGTKEIRMKIRSVQNTRKITKAMEMVAASKMKKSQDRMRATRPYVAKMLQIAMHVSKASAEYRHPFLEKREKPVRVGVIVVTTDKGLCGGLNTNVLRLVLQQYKEWQAAGVGVEFCVLGSKGLGFIQRMGGNIVSQAVQLGDRARLAQLIGPVKVLLDKYVAGEIDEVHAFFTRFFNTMRQDPRHSTLIPVPQEFIDERGQTVRDEATKEGGWDYIYEPDARVVLDTVMTRYVEGLVLQVVAENMASEQSARMVAMKAASDNAESLIDELTLIYNKNRQAGITKEISEIVGGAAAV
ncbi:MAG TPA: F0F1 ATP synthase subunit gamma [Burkholderiales bacterium]|nr:F0F1 ATP synthase subunit gamma [Burkholderiales bacterium]